MKKNNSLILKIFKEWNPLDVPKEITEDEYSCYVQQLLKECNTEESIYIFLKNMLTESMGITLANATAYDDLSKYSKAIYNIVNSFNYGNDMQYFTFQYQIGTEPKYTWIEKICVFFMKLHIPKADSTLEVGNVKDWYIEYDNGKECTIREIGVDENGEVIFKAPYKRNFGYWCDNDLTLDDYKKFQIHIVSKKTFEKLWNSELFCGGSKV